MVLIQFKLHWNIIQQIKQAPVTCELPYLKRQGGLFLNSDQSGIRERGGGERGGGGHSGIFGQWHPYETINSGQSRPLPF